MSLMLFVRPFTDGDSHSAIGAHTAGRHDYTPARRLVVRLCRAVRILARRLETQTHERMANVSESNVFA